MIGTYEKFFEDGIENTVKLIGGDKSIAVDDLTTEWKAVKTAGETLQKGAEDLLKKLKEAVTA